MRDRPVLHGRDHAPGGADPTLLLWDDVGSSGGGGTTGIQFATYPQAGTWLYASTTGSGGPNTNGIDFESSANLNLQSTGGTATLQSSGSIMVHSSGGAANLEGWGGGATVFGNTTVFILSNSGSGVAGIQNRLLNHGASFEIMDNTPLTQFRCTPTGTNVVTVYDHTGAAIFQVRDDGSLHGKTGKSLVFDL
jgi:hypothetical protein